MVLFYNKEWTQRPQQIIDHYRTRALFRHYPLPPYLIGAWWTRCSYLIGGVVYQEVDQAFS